MIEDLSQPSSSATPATRSAEAASPYLADFMIANSHALEGSSLEAKATLSVLESGVEGCEFVYSLGPYLRFSTTTTHRYSAVLREYKPHSKAAYTNETRPHVHLLSKILAYALGRLVDCSEFSEVVPIPPKLGELWSTYHLGHIMTCLNDLIDKPLSQAGTPIHLDALKFARFSPPMKDVALKCRLNVITEAMTANGLLKAGAVLLVDDIVASGATLREAARALRASGVRRVAALTLAKRVV